MENNKKPMLNLINFVGFSLFFLIISFFSHPTKSLISDSFLILLLTIFLLIQLNYINNRRKISGLYDWPVWVFILLLFSGNIGAAGKDSAWQTYFSLVMLFLPLYYIGRNISLSTNKNYLAGLICICVLIVALFGMLELIMHYNVIYEKLIPNEYYRRYVVCSRVVSTQFNPAVLGTYLLFCLPFALYLLHKRNFMLKYLAIFTIVLSVLSIIFTFSRGAAVSLVVLFLFHFWIKNHKKLFKFSLLGIIFVVIFCSFQKDQNINRFGFNRLISGSYDSILSDYRWHRIKMTGRILSAHPLFGVGFNNFRAKFDQYCDENLKNKEIYEFKIADNMYLTLLAETGIFGFSGFLIFIFLLLKQGFLRIKEEADSANKEWLIACLTVLVVFLVDMASYELFYWKNPYFLFCLICGFLSFKPRKAF